MSRTRVHGVLTQFLLAAVLFACPFPAQASEVSLKLEPGLALPLPGASRSQGFNIGSAASVKALLGLARYVDLETGVGFIGLPMSSVQLSSLSGMASTYGAGLRLKRPHDQRSFRGASPWIEAEALYVHAGRLEGVGFAMGAGFAFPVGVTRQLWLGPFVRYLDILQPNRTDVENRASPTLFAGLTFEIVVNR